MGKRKSSKKIIKKERPKVITIFNCPFCNHERSVEVKMKRTESRAEARCRTCSANYATTINKLSAPIDIYCEWVDECQKLNPADEVADVQDDDASEVASDDD
eukprot:CAMPEP_0114544120 /NCGR_PEP_ID=MMETSP0114-20121206/2709_1 /TAXON_ID=31324 /ORGANISM="Goniomonas sp, Strain m" /LENGTH=101 /DNA_ID=CAMNT_0001728483 /DNA_START=30 /DNA_END=335 /DNA_ORIENTATION=+